MITNVGLSFPPYHFEENDDPHGILVYNPPFRNVRLWSKKIPNIYSELTL
jgi:hypothetical protein